MDKFTNLYQLQLIDSAIDRLNSGKQGRPEARELAELVEKIKKIAALVSKEKELLNNSELAQKHLEDELDMLSAKIKKEESRLFGGEISNPKELK